MGKRTGSVLLKYVVFLLFAVVLWTWIFGLISDTVAEKKLVIYTDAEQLRSAELETHMTAMLPDGIEMIKAHKIGYAVFDEEAADSGDIYILSESAAMELWPDMSPINGLLISISERDLFLVDSVPYGIRINCSDSDNPFKDYIFFDTDEDIYLLFNAASIHTRSLNGSQDNAAVDFVKNLLEQK